MKNFHTIIFILIGLLVLSGALIIFAKGMSVLDLTTLILLIGGLAWIFYLPVLAKRAHEGKVNIGKYSVIIISTAVILLVISLLY